MLSLYIEMLDQPLVWETILSSHMSRFSRNLLAVIDMLSGPAHSCTILHDRLGNTELCRALFESWIPVLLSNCTLQFALCTVVTWCNVRWLPQSSTKPSQQNSQPMILSDTASTSLYSLNSVYTLTCTGPGSLDAPCSASDTPRSWLRLLCTG